MTRSPFALSTLASALFVLGLLAAPALATEPATPTNSAGQIEMTLKDHKFEPAEIHVPAGKPVTILLTNKDDAADEFDSDDLRVEKTVSAGANGVVRISPLVPGRYAFKAEFHPKTAQGVVVAE